jgi:4-amino-4-deoxy-L-arabinose transferase-like glycosyltransferase
MNSKYPDNKDLPFWLFTFSILILLTLPKLIQDGMFLDGMLYTCVSHNMANGVGTFWSPVFSPTYFNAGSGFFHEHPPLVFGIQSLFFRIFGDSMYVERFYVFITMCLTALLIKLIWDTVSGKNEEIKTIAWLPVIFWITIPECSWSYYNNMMENSMGVFALCAVLFTYKSVESEKNEIVNLLLAGLSVFLATMSKGIPGFFPLAVPFLHWLVFRRRSFVRCIFQTSLIILVPVLLYTVLFIFPESRESLGFYITKRLFGRIHDTPTVANRFYIIKRLLSELLPQILLTIIIISVTKLKKPGIPGVNINRHSVFFILTGLAAAAPLSLTLVQRGFYLVPSFPYFAIGLSILIAPTVQGFREYLVSNYNRFRIFMISGIVLFVFAIAFTFMQKGKTERDKDLLYDVHAIGKAIPVNSAITADKEITATYVLECYFIRYYNISLNTEKQEEYQIVKKSASPPDSTNFKRLDIGTKLFDLYKLK